MRRLVVVLALGLFGCALPVPPGLVCVKHEDCDGLRAGYCARAGFCTRECNQTNPCPDGSRCVAGGRRSVCLMECTDDGPCVSGMSCRDGVCQVVDALAP